MESSKILKKIKIFSLNFRQLEASEIFLMQSVKIVR